MNLNELVEFYLRFPFVGRRKTASIYLTKYFFEKIYKFTPIKWLKCHKLTASNSIFWLFLIQKTNNTCFLHFSTFKFDFWPKFFCNLPKNMHFPYTYCVILDPNCRSIVFYVTMGWSTRYFYGSVSTYIQMFRLNGIAWSKSFPFIYQKICIFPYLLCYFAKKLAFNLSFT